MIIEILELAAALEWIALGVLVFFKLRSLKHQAEVTLEGTGRSCVESHHAGRRCIPQEHPERNQGGIRLSTDNANRERRKGNVREN